MTRLSYNIQPGDVVAFSDLDWLARWINWTTGAVPWAGASHVAVCAKHPKTHRRVLFESTSVCSHPCLIARKPVKGVQCQTIPRRVKDYKWAWVYPLQERLSPLEVRKLTVYCVEHLGRQYDTIGAVRSRVFGCGWLIRRLWPKPEDLSTE